MRSSAIVVMVFLSGCGASKITGLKLSEATKQLACEIEKTKTDFGGDVKGEVEVSVVFGYEGEVGISDIIPVAISGKTSAENSTKLKLMLSGNVTCPLQDKAFERIESNNVRTVTPLSGR